MRNTHGFNTKREALAYEREFLLEKSNNLNMDFGTFVAMYLKNLKPRIKYNTYCSKVAVITSRIVPYFKNLNVSDITPMHIIKWQNELLSKRDQEGKGYSATYLRTINNQLSAIFNHACRYYELRENPCIKAGKMGKGKAKEMLFWTKDEYLKFAEVMKELIKEVVLEAAASTDVKVTAAMQLMKQQQRQLDDLANKVYMIS